MKIELGMTVRDTITGLEGIAVCRCLYLHGCDHIGIQPKANKTTGIIPPVAWIDEPQVESTGRRLKKGPKRTNEEKRRGGPGAHPGGRNHPSESSSSFAY